MTKNLFQQNRPTGFVRPKTLIEILDVSRSTLWRMEKAGILPKRVKIGSRSVGWRADEIEEFVKSRENV